MIRIDEIYNNLFWPYIKRNIPLTRLFFCDPPGRTDPESLFNFGDDVTEYNYIFMHDQEPIHLDIHKDLFLDVKRRNADLNCYNGPSHSAIITSEYNSRVVEEICKEFGWKHYYYFFHGWAALDWYRGYDKTFLIADPDHRTIGKSFIAPNRIIGGKRDHRVLLLYHLFRQQVSNAWISCPKICPYENTSIEHIAKRYQGRYPDIVQTFGQTDLPLQFPNETDHPMHSCWLSLWAECEQTLCYVVTETVFFGQRNHITEKTFKPICQRMPFVLASSAHSLEYLRSYGFKTFGSVWDESYDEEQDDFTRLEKIAALLADLDRQSPKELAQIYQACRSICDHNFEHFYSGSFEQVLWQELNAMMRSMAHDFRI